jgi:hypothetical protein
MNRLPDWPARLQAVVAARLCVPFAWGVHDCCLFGADCADACTGVDLAADFRGRYRCEREAYRLLHQLVGEGGVAALAASRLPREIAPAFAQRGDIGLAVLPEHPGRPLLAVCNGTVWLGPGAAGLLATPAPSRAWSL